MTTLLIDGDVLLYKATVVSEVEIDWGDDVITIHSDLGQIRNLITGMVSELCEAFETDEVKIALSSARNFRKDIDDAYKASRSERKPVGYRQAKEWLRMEFKCIEVDGLEADDVLGVLATQKSHKGDCVICTIDKDLKQIPGTYHNMDTHETVEISETESHRFHMYQTLVGDPTDGYGGCPGIGPVRANKILDDADGDLWSAVVAAYTKAGLTEDDALRQARLARILQLNDINPKTKEPILWKPSASSVALTSRTRVSRSHNRKAADSVVSTSRRKTQSSSLSITRVGKSNRSSSSHATKSRSQSRTRSNTSSGTTRRTGSKTSGKRDGASRC